MTRTAVVFGGGGVKAAAHVGAHRALSEAGLTPAHYLGTSMGAVIAAMYATGLSQGEIERTLAAVTRRDVARLRPLLALRGLTAPSLFRLEPLRQTFERLVPARAFGELKTPLTVTAVDLLTGGLVLLGAPIPAPGEGVQPDPGTTGWTNLGPDVPLIEALVATCALPFFYPPPVIGGRKYVDGGFRMVVPWEPAAALRPELVFSVDTGAGFDEMGGEDDSAMPALARAHDASIGILMAANTALQFPAWGAGGGPRLLHVRPRVRRGSTFRVEEGEWYREEGYRAAREVLAAGETGAEKED